MLETKAAEGILERLELLWSDTPDSDSKRSHAKTFSLPVLRMR
jgi:hypothetical protein